LIQPARPKSPARLFFYAVAVVLFRMGIAGTVLKPGFDLIRAGLLLL